MEQALRLLNRHFVDAGVAVRHQPVFGEMPILVAIGAESLPAIIAIFIGIADGDPVAGESPQFLDEPIFMFSVPLALQEALSLFPIGREFDPITPACIERVSEGDLGGVAAVPAIFGETNLFDRGFVSEGGQRRTRHFICFRDE